MTKINKKRLAVELPESMHRELMEIAEKRNITLTQLIMILATEKILIERQYNVPSSAR